MSVMEYIAHSMSDERRTDSGGDTVLQRHWPAFIAVLACAVVIFVYGVIHADGGDKFSLVETIKTKSGARTMALDPKTHKLFLPAIETKPNPDQITCD